LIWGNMGIYGILWKTYPQNPRNGSRVTLL
jgi:hypothetical protein